LTRKFYRLGQINATTKYFYSLDQRESVVQASDAGGTVQTEQQFDPYGRVAMLLNNASIDFAFSGYYVHSRSGLKGMSLSQLKFDDHGSGCSFRCYDITQL